MPREVLGEEFGGTVTCDFPGRCSPSPRARARAGYGGYNKLGVLQRCWAHLLQDAKELAELNADRPEVVAWESASGGLKALYQAAKAFSHPEVPPTNNPASQGEVAWRMLLCEVPTPPK